MKDLVNDGFARVVKPYIDTQNESVKAQNKSTQEMLATVEEDETDASRAYAIGEQLILDGILYNVIDSIAQHGIISAQGAGANIEAADPITQQLSDKQDSPTILTSTLSAGATTLTFTDSSITNNCMIDVYTDIYGISPTNMVQSGTTVTLTFEEQSDSISIKLVVRG